MLTWHVLPCLTLIKSNFRTGSEPLSFPVQNIEFAVNSGSIICKIRSSSWKLKSNTSKQLWHFTQGLPCTFLCTETSVGWLAGRVEMWHAFKSTLIVAVFGGLFISGALPTFRLWTICCCLSLFGRITVLSPLLSFKERWLTGWLYSWIQIPCGTCRVLVNMLPLSFVL